MLSIIGPAKTIDMSPHGITEKSTNPGFLDHSELLVNELRNLSPVQLRELMKVSEKLAVLSFERFSAWNASPSPGERNQAIMAFSGEVFNGLDARSLDEEDLLFAQNHMRILSGLYGVLRPLDHIMPYRLEMGSRFENKRGKNLYEFWKEIIPPEVIKATDESGGSILVNLASNEYFKSIDPKKFPYRIITPVFKEQDSKGFRNVTIYAKKARGLMLRFIIRNRINDPGDLKAFDADGYYFSAEHSGDDEWLFAR